MSARSPHLLGALRPLLAALVAAGGVPAGARAEEPKPPPPPPARTVALGPRTPARPEPAGSWHARHALAFQRNWGVDVVGVRRVSSGLMLRFDYRVVAPAKAGVLTDKKTRPYLIDEATGIALAVPAMEKVGELRQVAPLQEGRTYYIIFGNPGGLVKHGSKVTLVSGRFRAEGLEVD